MRPILTGVVLLVAVASAGPARAQEWTLDDPPFPGERFRTWEYATLPVLYGPVLLRFLAPREHADWRGDHGIDLGARQGLALPRGWGRDVALRTGDATWVASMVWPLVDVAIAYWHHDWDDVAGQMLLIDVQAFGVASFLFFMAQWLFPRDRPYHAVCEEDPEYDPDCFTPVRYQSFPSGHFAMAIAGAAVTCLHHTHLPLYGGGWDVAACGVAVGLAAYTGLSRLLSNVHWLSDVLIGGLFGAVAGWLVPATLHYGFGGS